MNIPTPPEIDLATALKALQRVLFEYPIATQAAFSALVAEGRRYAETAEGQSWQERLADSQLIREGRVVWEVLSQGSFCEDPDVLLPSVFVDAIARASAVNGIEPLLSLLFEQQSVDNGA